MAAHTILFDYTLRSADECECRTRHKLLPNGTLIQEPAKPEWSPVEPDAETIQATLEIQDGPGGASDTFVLTGDQHRDLESNDLFDEFLRDIAAGWSPEAALSRTLESISETPGPG